MRILVVEDFRMLRESMALGLREAGFAVDEAAEGETGLWLAQSNEYAVIVLDLMLPKMDAVDTFATKYEGEEVTVEAAKELLGYQPSISRSIPRGVQLVSTRVLKLPECNYRNQTRKRWMSSLTLRVAIVDWK